VVPEEFGHHSSKDDITSCHCSVNKTRQGQFGKRNTKGANAREEDTMEGTEMQKRHKGPRFKRGTMSVDGEDIQQELQEAIQLEMEK
jgi:hypothetical protein